MASAFTPERARDYAARSHQARRVNTAERKLREIVESVPPLTDEQRQRLASVLTGSAA